MLVRPCEVLAGGKRASRFQGSPNVNPANNQAKRVSRRERKKPMRGLFTLLPAICTFYCSVRKGKERLDIYIDTQMILTFPTKVVPGAYEKQRFKKILFPSVAAM